MSRAYQTTDCSINTRVRSCQVPIFLSVSSELQLTNMELGNGKQKIIGYYCRGCCEKKSSTIYLTTPIVNKISAWKHKKYKYEKNSIKYVNFLKITHKFLKEHWFNKNEDHSFTLLSTLCVGWYCFQSIQY